MKIKKKIYCKTKMLLQKLNEPIACNNILNFLYMKSLKRQTFLARHCRHYSDQHMAVKLFIEHELPQFPQFHISTAWVSKDLL